MTVSGISGNLEDVSVAEVMQFIHLGGRTGTLRLENGNIHAEIGFHRGRIVNSWSPESKRLGDLLISENLITREILDQALELQQSEHPKRSLGQILVTTHNLDLEAIRVAVESQIEQTVYGLVTWTRGTFNFALDELRPVDDIGVYPGDILPNIDLNTQMVVLEALRIFDERNRDAEAGKPVIPSASPRPAEPPPPPPRSEPTPAPPPAPAPSDDEDSFDREIGEALEPSSPPEPPPKPPRLQVVTQDTDLLARLKTTMDDEDVEMVRVELMEAGSALPGESPPVVLLDLRGGSITLDHVRTIRRSRSRAALVTVADENTPTADAYAAGALAALPAEPEAVLACYRNVLRTKRDSPDSGANREEVKAGFAKLRRVVADLRSGLLSATMALNLMNIVSESVERAVLFLVRRDHIVSLGAFGFSNNGKPLAQATQGLRLEIDRINVITDAIDDGRARSVSFVEANLPQDFIDLIGEPRSGQVVIFPVLGSERVISVIYTDNGPDNRPIEEIEIMELATAQVGIAFENELLRRQLAQSQPS